MNMMSWKLNDRSERKPKLKKDSCRLNLKSVLLLPNNVVLGDSVSICSILL